MWADPRLMWNPDNYDKIKYIKAPASKFWLPDLSIMNAAGATNLISYASSQNIGIDFTGTSYLTLSLPSQQTRCHLNVKKYPFDTQKCSIIIGSWIYNTLDVDLGVSDQLSSSEETWKSTFDKNYIDHPYWQLESFSKKTVFDSSRFLLVNQYRNLSIQSEDLSFDLTLKRRPLYVMINSIYINFILNIIILMAFFMPFTSQIGLCKLFLSS